MAEESGKRNRPKPGAGDLAHRVEELTVRLAGAEEVLRAIRSGEVDALLVSTPQGERVFTLAGAERPYRILIEAMGEGALTLSRDGTVLYANQAFARILGLPLEQVLGANLARFLPPEKGPGLKALLAKDALGSQREEAVLLTETGAEVPVLLSVTPLPESDPPQVCLVVTDLTEAKRREAALSRLNAELQAEIEQRREAEAAVRREVTFREAIENSLLAGLAAIDLEGRFIHVNDAFCAMTGWSRKELLRMRPPYGFSPPGKSEPYTADFAMALAAGHVPGVMELTLLRRGGEPFDVLMHASPLRDAQGIVRGCVVSFTDISAWKEAQAALKESEERFRTLVEHSLVGFFIIQEGRVVFLNPEAEKLFGPLPGGFPLEPLTESVHPGDRERFLSLCDASRTAGSTRVETDLRLVAEDGRGHAFEGPAVPPEPEASPTAPPNPGASPAEEGAEPSVLRWVHGQATPILFRGRRALLVNMVDVTRAKEMERLAMNRERMAALGQMAAGIAHEIRNPLSGLNLYLSAIRKILVETEFPERKSRESAATTLEMMQAASDRIEMVVRKVMNFARPAAPSMTLVDLNLAVREAVHLSAMILRRSGIQIEFAPAKELPPSYADLQLIEQVLLNLITNAAQAMERQEGKGGRRKIAIASGLENGYVVITVADSGPGVPEGIREKIFEPHFTTKEGGAGIGLSLSRRIIADHGGFLEVGPSDLGGAEFRIRIPAGEKRKSPRL